LKSSILSRRCSIAPILVFLLALLIPAPLDAAPEAPYWQRFDVGIDIQTSGEFTVTEDQTVLFGSNSARHGFRSIPLDRVDQIVDVSVSEPDRPYQVVGQAADGEEPPYSYQLQRKDGELLIDWWFPPTRNAPRTFLLRYRVIGGLRYYEGGDQLYWKAVYADRPYLVQSSQVMARFPFELSNHVIKTAAYPPELGVQGRLADPRTVRFDARNLPAETGMEIRIQFPHGLVSGQPSEWQAAADREDWYFSNAKPLVNLFLGVLGLLVLILGPLLLFLRWYSNGRDPKVGQVPTLLSEPPGDLPPAVAGTLVDERADVRDAVATLVDWARRGIIRIVDETPSKGRKAKREFRLEKLREEPPELREYERVLFSHLFPGVRWVHFSELKTRLIKAIPSVRKLLYQEVTEAGFFRDNPEKVRRRHMIWGGAVSTTGWAVALLAAPFFFDYAELAFFPFAALGTVGLLQLFAASRMARKSEMGVLAAAQWRAFGRFIRESQPKDDLSSHLDRFEPYLPYAIALGANKEWVRKFASAGAPTPDWYGWDRSTPVHRGHWWMQSRSDHDRSNGDRDATAGAEGGPVDLQSLSDSGAFGLQDLSDGLVEMLNSTSKALSSGGSSSGGWSGGGGGSSGGGGGGGGSGGFN